MWILYIVGGLFLIGVLSAFGVFQEILTLVFITVFFGAICHWIFNAWGIGLLVGSGLYVLSCIGRIFSDTEILRFNDDGDIISREKKDRLSGIVGIIVFVILLIISLLNNMITLK